MDLTQNAKSQTEEATCADSKAPKTSLTSNTCLESLGFVVDNGKPRFKLDEPVTSTLNTMTTEYNANDEDDPLSFVVLGKSSLDAIQASSLASYVDIQHKSMSVDYNSIVASLNASEVQKMLTELLQENTKLKETLKQNNLAMKRQFNTLAVWQEDLLKVHQNHKQKFSETTQFINHLKKENTELKIKLSMQQTENTDYGFEAINVSHEFNNSDVTIDQVKLQENISLLTEELNNSKLECAKSKKEVAKHENVLDQAAIEMTQAAQEIEIFKVDKIELASAMESLNDNYNQTSTKNVKSQNSSETYFAKDQEIARLKESIVLLEKKLQYILTPLQSEILLNSSKQDHSESLSKLEDFLSESQDVLSKLQNLSSEPQNLSSNHYRQKFVQTIKHYNNRLQALTECFVAQVDRFATIEKYLKEVTDILEVLLNDNLKSMHENNLLPSETLYQYREKLHNYYKALLDERFEIFNDRQNLIESQNQFQKIFSDYNSILYRLEISLDENAKSDTLISKMFHDKFQKQKELENIMCEKQVLEKEKIIFNEEKDKLQEEKKLFENQKKSFDIECESLQNEKELLQHERISLSEEKMSLDHQSQLYEKHEKALQDEKILMEVRHEQLLKETNNLQQNIQSMNIELEKLKQQLSQNAEEIILLKTQLKLYEEDFKQEKKLKESLLEEKNKLDVELQKQVDFNKQLQQDVRILQGGKTNSVLMSDRMSEYSTEVSVMPPCPKCETAFATVQALTEHIEQCLNLN